MIVYKITNLVNNKVYIGQTKFSAEERFIGHCINAFDKNCDYHLSRALRKWGKENFKLEVLEECETRDEANFFEKHYIKVYRATEREFGYNMTFGGEGGDTYLLKSESELNVIKSKISQANSGGHNGNAHTYKMKNIETGEVSVFGSSTECDRYFYEHENIIGHRIGLKNIAEVKDHGFQTLFFKKYIFAELSDEFSMYTNVPKKKGTFKWKVLDSSGSVEFVTNSTDDLINHYNWSYKTFKKQALIENKTLVQIGSRK